MRQVTTVAGATSKDLRCQFRDQVGNSLLERDIEGKAPFFGGNLKANYASLNADTRILVIGDAKTRADISISGLRL